MSEVIYSAPIPADKAQEPYHLTLVYHVQRHCCQSCSCCHQRYEPFLNCVRGNCANAFSVWTTVITNTAYLPGLLTLDYSLRRVGSKYPLVVLYTGSFPAEGHAALDARGIKKRHVPYLLPSVPKDFTNDVRFYDCWSKLTPFSLTEYERVVQLDSDMLILQSMDELMDIELDPPDMAGAGNRVFAASHACLCNPLRKPHYPPDWYGLPPSPLMATRAKPTVVEKDTGQLCIHHPAFCCPACTDGWCSRHGRLGNTQWRPSGREPGSSYLRHNHRPAGYVYDLEVRVRRPVPSF